MQIYVSGSLAYDRIMDFPGRFSDHILPDKIHILNVAFTVNGLIERFGGTAGNIAYNLVLLGQRPRILAAAGRDFAPYRQWLQKQGLPLEAIRVVEHELTASAYITTDQSDNQITGFNPGAMRHPCGARLEPPGPQGALAIIAPGNLEDMAGIARRCRECAIPYICDPGQSIPALSPEALIDMIDGARLLISNDYELELIRQKTGMELSTLLARTGAVITTLAEKGSLVTTRQGQVRIAAARAARVVDPTGAGDAYRAGLITGLILGRPLTEAARMGAACASFAVEQQGTQEHRFGPQEFTTRLEAIDAEEIR
jgi:adenosine kinase